MNLSNHNFDFVGKRRIWFILSAVLIIAGIIGYFANSGFNLGIDFLGGSLMEIEFTRDVNVNEIREVMKDMGYGNAILQKTDSNKFIIRTTPIEVQQKNEIISSLDESIGINGEPLQDRNVLPGFGKQITKFALYAVGISILGILIYVWIRFEIRFGAAAILCLIHDVLITIGVYAILHREVNTSTIAAILTVLGYSINDTIVVFDRIRENTQKNKNIGYNTLVNDSVNQTLTRSINTSMTTLIPILLLLILGTTALKDFALALTVGITIGTYSSIFVASPLLVVWNNKFPKYKK